MTKSFALTFLSVDEAPLTAAVDAAFEAYRHTHGGDESVKVPMLALLRGNPSRFREMFPLAYRRAGT